MAFSQREKLLMCHFVSYYILAAQESLKPEHLQQNTSTLNTADTSSIRLLVGLKCIAEKSSH